MNYLLDTCVLSEFTRHAPDACVIRWIDSLDEMKLYLSAVTIGEIQHGVERLAESRRKNILLSWLNNDLLQRFEHRVLPLDAQTMMVWGRLTARLESTGRPMSIMDSLIASTALQHNLVLLTRNVSDFSACELEIINPWKSDVD